MIKVLNSTHAFNRSADIQFVAIAVLLLYCTSSHAAPVTLAAGDYLDDQFIARLESTRSPVASISEANGPQVITVRHRTDNPDALIFNGNYGWHEGSWLFSLYPDGRMDQGEEKIDYPRPQIDSAHHFRFREAEAHKFHHASWRGYTYVGNADDAILRCTLTGRFVDRTGRPIEFGDDGRLRGLSSTSFYALNNDHALGPAYDYVELSSTPDWLADGNRTEIAFENRGSNLMLYRIRPATGDGPGMGERDLQHPIAVLKRLSPWQPCSSETD